MMLSTIAHKTFVDVVLHQVHIDVNIILKHISYAIKTWMKYWGLQVHLMYQAFSHKSQVMKIIICVWGWRNILNISLRKTVKYILKVIGNTFSERYTTLLELLRFVAYLKGIWTKVWFATSTMRPWIQVWRVKGKVNKLTNLEYYFSWKWKP